MIYLQLCRIFLCQPAQPKEKHKYISHTWTSSLRFIPVTQISITLLPALLFINHSPYRRPILSYTVNLPNMRSLNCNGSLGRNAAYSVHLHLMLWFFCSHDGGDTCYSWPFAEAKLVGCEPGKGRPGKEAFGGGGVLHCTGWFVILGRGDHCWGVIFGSYSVEDEHTEEYWKPFV